MTGAEAVRLCDGIAAAMLPYVEGSAGADTLMLTHAVRDLATLCSEQQRQLNLLLELAGF